MSLFNSLTNSIATLFNVGRRLEPPPAVSVVQPFDATRYLGQWYEIARLDHRFERGLDHVTATYRLRDDGGLTVINRGYDPRRKHWKESRGKAFFTGSAQRAALKVSFFGPFYSGYNIIALTDDYRYALICGPNYDYLWLLSRTTQPDPAVIQRLTAQAREAGFAVNKLIWVKQRDHADAARSV